MAYCWCRLAEGDCVGYGEGFSTAGAACYYAKTHAYNSYGMPCDLPTFPSFHKEGCIY